MNSVPTMDFKGKELFYASIEVERHATKKNGRTIFFAGKRPILGKSQALRDAESNLVLELRSARNTYGITEPIECDMRALFIFHFANYFTKRGPRNKKLGDLSNLYQLPEDCMEEAGIIVNDSLICSHDGSRRVPSDRNRLEIYLLRFEEEVCQK
jgi:Holliday junction resolvase RusA-like endonuclease